MAVLLRTSAGTTLKAGPPGPATDPDAQAFINAVIAGGGTLTSVEKLAINGLVTGFKANGTWAKKTAVYPFVGATANEHKWNLKDPRDLDAARRLVFTGAWVHSSQGIAGNATDTAANTFITLDELTGQPNNDSLMSIWSRTNIQSNNQVDIGVADTNVSGSWTLLSNISSAELYFQWGIPQTPVWMAAVNSYGHFVGKLLNTEMASFKNGVKYAWRTPPIAHIPNTTTHVYLGATGLVGAAPGYWCGRQLCWGEVDLFGYTDAEVTADYNTILEFQTALGRQNPPALLAATLVILAFLLTQGITLTHQQQLDLDILLGGMSAPAPAAKKSRKKEKPLTMATLPDPVKDYLTSQGFDIT